MDQAISFMAQPGTVSYSILFSDSFMSSESLDFESGWGSTDDIATTPFHLSLSSSAFRESPNPQFHPFFHVVFPSLLLSPSPPSFYCPL